MRRSPGLRALMPPVIKSDLSSHLARGSLAVSYASCDPLLNPPAVRRNPPESPLGERLWVEGSGAGATSERNGPVLTRAGISELLGEGSSYKCSSGAGRALRDTFS